MPPLTTSVEDFLYIIRPQFGEENITKLADKLFYDDERMITTMQDLLAEETLLTKVPHFLQSALNQMRKSNEPKVEKVESENTKKLTELQTELEKELRLLRQAETNQNRKETNEAIESKAAQFFSELTVLRGESTKRMMILGCTNL
jgi:DNA anti-recombination protein RmuC